MAYNFRNRNLLNSRGTYFGSSGSDNESYDSDPDFGTPTRLPRRSMPRAAGIGIPGSEGENSGGNTERKRSGRPPRSNANGEEDTRGLIERHRRRKRSKFSLVPHVPIITKRSVVSWLISLGILKENEEVWYVDIPSGNILGEGKVTREGIECNCCSCPVTAREFEVHAGRKTKRPYQHIVQAVSQHSLFACQIKAWGHKEEKERRKFNNIQPAPKAVDKSDDACMICADGGDLICCEKCPSTFHPKCIFMESIPQGDWLCFYCVCKYCGTANGVLKKCTQCEKLYHGKCGGEKLDLMNTPAALFCGKSCRMIYQRLQRLLGVRNDLRDGLSWTLVQRRDKPLDGSCADDNYTRVEGNSKIGIAWQVMNECFLSTIDRHTRANIVQSIVYNRGSNFTRINYSSFYTAVLEKEDEMICAASIRVHGKMLAEMPFIGTRRQYRRQGMANILEKCVESTLCSLNIEKLVIPSMNDLTCMWMDKYFFAPVEDESLKQALSVYNTVMFPAQVVKLHKTLAMLPDLNQGPPETNANL
ncbi:hypothetical protein HRI_000027100 [Hibiscus trionum]|uniref:PHD-type domain-containing protein n=1 Tax=Hibiscus trionum TaxID=183268 RepID=A0A9W7GSM1_HIBTR|nr:hypothetical protein HRI_000027100 [Hibiscus trionum]